ncbi:MAG: hypothetical protein AAF224_03000 [Pseudomonadota bacterium]
MTFMQRLFFCVCLAVWFASPASVAAPPCTPSAATEAVRIVGVGPDGALSDYEKPYVAGARDFYQELDNGWVFALMRAENGWSIRLYENNQIGDARDLTAMTPPLRGAPNPRDIFGWHFRNAANTGPNEGDVNAPQALRTFIISPSLAGTGGYKPPVSGGAPAPNDGMGWLEILDYGLAGLEPGQRARMNYLEFNACLAWPRSDAERDWLKDRESLVFTDEDKEMFGACGLDLNAFELNAAFAPRTLGGDIDGDGALDQIAQINRRTDNKRGLALCRAGERLSLIGIDDALGDAVAPRFVDQLEAWHWIEKDRPAPAHLKGFELPAGDGDILILERIEKQAVAVYWRDGALNTKSIYGVVEP